MEILGLNPCIVIGDFNSVRSQNEKLDEDSFDFSAATLTPVWRT